jgi:uncharacterized SAM-binding protein YcdF (DUF218 family)
VVRPLAALGALIVLISFTPVTSWMAGVLAGPWNDPKGEVLVVLGGALQDTGYLGHNSYLRSLYAAMIYREGGVDRIVVSGGSDARSPVAELMRDAMITHGVPKEAITVETASGSTRENAERLKPVLAGIPGRKVLLTSDYHMYRAIRVFRKAGIEIEPRPFPDVRKRATGWRARWPAFLDVADEAVKIVYYGARGWI